MTTNYDTRWSWAGKEIPVMVMGKESLSEVEGRKILQSENPFTATKALMDEKLETVLSSGQYGDQMAELKEMAESVRSTLDKFAVRMPPGRNVSLFPVESSRLKHTPEGIPFQKRTVHAFAELLSEQLGFPVAEGIRQIADASHSSFSTQDLNDSHCYFEGKIEKGRSYIIVDDLINSGRTIRDAARYIELNGGKVLGVICQTTQLISSRPVERPKHPAEMYVLVPDETTMHQFNSLFPDTAMVNHYLERSSLSVEQLTSQEMKGLINGLRFRKELDASITPQDYLEKITRDWKKPERPQDFESVPPNTPTDLELMKENPGFFGNKRITPGR